MLRSLGNLHVHVVEAEPAESISTAITGEIELDEDSLPDRGPGNRHLDGDVIAFPKTTS